jgi:hypothetical protein
MIRLTKHAQEAIGTRRIDPSWVEAAVSVPDFEADPRHPERTRSCTAIAEFGGRMLRVVHRPEGDDIIIITVHSHRGARQ